MILSFSKVTKIFHGAEETVEAVKSISFSVGEGELVAIKGPSGSGKTTLLLIAGCLLKPSHGVVTLDGQDPYAVTSNERSRIRAERIGFVFQEFHLIPYLTVWGNILSPAGASRKPGIREHANGLVERFNLQHRVGHYPSALSTGERQRTALARAFLNEPDIILADEPTGNLDRENAETVLKCLRDFTDSGGSVLLATHDARAVGYADSTIYVNKGNAIQNRQSN